MEDIYIFYSTVAGANGFLLYLGRLLPKTYGLLYVGSYNQPFAEIKVRK